MDRSERQQDGHPFETEARGEEIVVKFDPDNVRKYLDWAVEKWRQRLKHARDANDETDSLVARCYIDAFLSVKRSLFGGEH